VTSLSWKRHCLPLSVSLLIIMPPTQKRKKNLSLQLKKARACKKRKTTVRARQQSDPEGLTDLLNLSHDALDTSNDCVDPDFDLEDGHERPDVVEYRKNFLRRMVTLGFLNESNAPTVEARAALPSHFHSPPQNVVDKTIIFSMMKQHSRVTMPKKLSEGYHHYET